MGQLHDKLIVQSRKYLDPNEVPVPALDYDNTYPITVYEAVKRSFDDNSTNLLDELDSIYRLINDKQSIIDAGIPNQIMTWTGVKGQIGSLEIVKKINNESVNRSNTKIPTEIAVGNALDDKISIAVFNTHSGNNEIHITDVERSRWNAMAPLSTLQAHISNTSLHITNEERAAWNKKANQETLDSHIYDLNNPHSVTAHQVGTYTRKEIDELFQNIRDSFFNYKNISWDERNNQAKLVEYHAANWNPNFILSYEDNLPDIEDPELTYFALKPVTDYKTNETQDCIIYVKQPGMVWQEVGLETMEVGDMVIKYPETTMYVWVQGRFMVLFTGNNGETINPGGESTSDLMWRPTVSEDGTLTWTRSNETVAPTSVVIKGKDGYSPIKGVDYDDGQDGAGVAVGGSAGQILVKLTDDNYDTTWKSLSDVLGDLVIGGGTLPDSIINWDTIKGRPEWYNELGENEDGFITQKAVTRQFGVVRNEIDQILEKVSGSNGLDTIKQNLSDHVNDFNNPHRVTAAQIGAVTNSTFLDHSQNVNNPHNVSADQIGLGNVNNTSDMDKPISNATQEALDKLKAKLGEITGDVDDLNSIMNVTWNNATTTLTFIFRDGSEIDVALPIKDVFESIYYDQATKELVMILPDGTEHRIDVSNMIQSYIGSVSTNIQVEVLDNYNIKATIVPGSITGLELISSIVLRGSPTTTTQPISDKSTRIATTEFVRNQVIDNLISYETDRALSANMGRILNQNKVDADDIVEILNNLGGFEIIDNLDSTNPSAALSANMGRHLDLTKAPRVHTSPSGSTFGRATVSLFGHTRASDVDPLMDGTVFKGTDDGLYARGDHRHPTDETRAPMHWPDVEHNQYELTGEPRAEMAPDASNDSRIATTEWVRRNAVGVVKGYCHTSKSDPNKTADLVSTFMDPVVFIRQIGSTVAVTFDNEDKSGSANITTLDVNQTGAAEIIFGGEKLTNGMIGKNFTHMFVFDGTYWRLINPVPGTGMGQIIIGPGGKTEDDTPEEVINKLAGYNGITTQGSGGTDKDGQVNRVWCTINFSPKATDVEMEFSDAENCWAFKMGDGSFIKADSPTVVSITNSSAVVEFALETWYPSNSPCQLVYRTNKAWYQVKEI